MKTKERKKPLVGENLRKISSNFFIAITMYIKIILGVKFTDAV